jgi:hypothetical protein
MLVEHKSELERIHGEADSVRLVDERMADLQSQIDGATHNLTRQLPGVEFDDLTGPTPIGQVFRIPRQPRPAPTHILLATTFGAVHTQTEAEQSGIP